jgi:hypothetical protein
VSGQTARIVHSEILELHTATKDKNLAFAPALTPTPQMSLVFTVSYLCFLCYLLFKRILSFAA